MKYRLIRLIVIKILIKEINRDVIKHVVKSWYIEIRK